MKKCRRNLKPGWGQDQAPDVVMPIADGKQQAVWFRPKTAPKPERYDYSVPHKGGASWRVYFLALCAAMVPLCCVARLVATFVERGIP